MKGKDDNVRGASPTRAGQRRGKAFEREWYRGMELFKSRYRNCRIHRHYDLSDYVGKRCPACKKGLDVCGSCGTVLPISKARPPKQPGDFETIYKGISILQELKSSANSTYYNASYVKYDQLMSLLEHNNAGGIGVLVIQNRSKARNFKVYVIPIVWFMELLKSTRRVLTWDMLNNISIINPNRIFSDTGPYYDHECVCVAVERYKAGLIIKGEVVEWKKEKISPLTGGVVLHF